MHLIRLIITKKPGLAVYLLAVIVVLGFILRAYLVADNPPGFFCDEAVMGSDAYSLLKTGKDIYGNTFPVFFRSLGDYRPPIAIYSAIPFIAILGLNEISVRLSSVVFGIFGIILIYFLGKELYSKYFGLLAAFITATMPWLIHYDRVAFGFTIYNTFFVATVLLFLKSTQNKSYIIPAFTTAALTFYTYQPAKLLIPLLLTGIGFIYIKTFLKHRIEALFGIAVFCIISLPLAYTFLNGEAIARFEQISIFSTKLSLMSTFHLFIYNYFIQFSPMYFLSGEPTNITRHFINGLNPLLIVTIPFLMAGFLYAFFTLKNNISKLLIFWLIIYPIAGAVTAEGPFTSRSIIGAPIFALLISLGILTIVSLVKKYINSYLLTSFIIIVVLINLGFFTNFYFTKYPLISADFWGWQYGPKDIIQYFTSHEKMYDDMYMTPEFNAAHIFLFFYAPHSCNNCKIGLPDSSYTINRKQLFAVSPQYISMNPYFIYKPVKTFYYPNGQKAFILVEIKNDIYGQ